MKLTTGVIAVAVLATAGFFGWRELDRKPPPAPPPPPVPVSAAAAKEADVPVYLRGIGTVRALNMAEVRPQVGGILLAVPVNEGDRVKKGDVLAVVDPRPFQADLDKARAQRIQDQAQLDNARTDLGRYSSLAKGEFASRQQVDTQRSSVDRLAGVVQGDDATVETAQINLGYTVVRAPLDGQVGLRRVDAGNLVQANGTGPGIFSVVQVQPISVVFTLPAAGLPQIRAAMARGPVPVLADTSDTSQELARGVLLTPDNTVDTASGTISLKAQFDNDNQALTPGQFVSVRLQSDRARGIGIPHEAIQHGQDKLFVMIAKPDKTAEIHDVQVAYDDGKVAVLSKGVAAGDTVVTSGQSRIGNGTRLAIQDPNAPPGQAPGQDSAPQQDARK